MPNPLPHPPILLITDRTQVCRPLPDVVAQAVAGGCRWVSVREKDLSAADRLALVADLLPLLRAMGGRLTVHGDADAATMCDGLHLPAGADIAAHRVRLGPGALIGASCHDGTGVVAARAAGADYVTLSPVFLTASKPGYGPALGLQGLVAARAAVGPDFPILALGGVDAATAADCARTGATGIAVMGGIMRAGDPESAFAGLIRAWDKG